jgi:hypothetical protein
MRVRQLRDRSSRALPFSQVPHAEVEGREKQTTDAGPLAQVLLSELPELELEFLGRVDALLHQ